MRWLVFVWASLVSLLTSGWAQSDLVIERALWGFAGRPVPEAFNPLVLEISNPSGDPFDGELRLARGTGGGRTVGISENQWISLAPGGRRLVSFTPYVDTSFTHYHWLLTWRSGQETLENSLLPTALGAPATVMITPRPALPGDPSTSGFRLYPAAYFPTNVSATSGLATVIMNQAPSWEPARAEAFWQWLQRGGTLHLFPGPDGPVPRFEGILETLNDPNLDSPGYGRIARHTRPLHALNAAEREALQSLLPMPKPEQRGQASVFRAFGMATLPEVPWDWIYVTALVYLFLIGPGHYLFAKKNRRDYRLTLLVLLILVGAFAWLFAKIGRRGFGESSQWLSASFAYPVGQDGLYDVTQWSHAFVTKGDRYQFRYSSPRQLFEAQHQMEPVRGSLLSGNRGHLEIDLPLYSSRNLIGRAVMKGDPLEITVDRWVPQSRTVAIDIAIDIVSGIDIEKAWLRENNAYHALTSAGSGRWIYQQTFDSWKHASFRADSSPGQHPADESWQHIDRQLRPWLLHWRHHAHVQAGPVSEHAELLLHAESPESFRPVSPPFDDYHGSVLYVIPLRTALKEYEERQAASAAPPVLPSP